MGYIKVITSEGVQDMEDMSQEEMLGLMVALMAEKK
jgi:diadenosine tetraphosphate (Ap4A) HIT family hydrolase